MAKSFHVMTTLSSLTPIFGWSVSVPSWSRAGIPTSVQWGPMIRRGDVDDAVVRRVACPARDEPTLAQDVVDESRLRESVPRGNGEERVGIRRLHQVAGARPDRDVVVERFDDVRRPDRDLRVGRRQRRRIAEVARCFEGRGPLQGRAWLGRPRVYGRGRVARQHRRALGGGDSVRRARRAQVRSAFGVAERGSDRRAPRLPKLWRGRVPNRPGGRAAAACAGGAPSPALAANRAMPKIAPDRHRPCRRPTAIRVRPFRFSSRRICAVRLEWSQ